MDTKEESKPFKLFVLFYDRDSMTSPTYEAVRFEFDLEYKYEIDYFTTTWHEMKPEDSELYDSQAVGNEYIRVLYKRHDETELIPLYSGAFLRSGQLNAFIKMFTREDFQNLD